MKILIILWLLFLPACRPNTGEQIWNVKAFEAGKAGMTWDAFLEIYPKPALPTVEERRKMRTKFEEGMKAR